ncbi:MAG: AAA family ATPase [Candidatus Omnitrophica bacterium]|nr:AAA family ATPase [Candidatus Omnitrophota bacterium]
MPFQNTPDPRFFYASPQHDEALSRLLYAVQEKVGAAMLTGIFGCGKTLLGEALLKGLVGEKYKIAFIRNPKLDYIELLAAIVQALGGGKNLPTKKSDLVATFLLNELKDILYDNLKDGSETVIIVDEAHVIEDPSVLEGLRLLLNFQSNDQFLLTLLLFGQPELREHVNRFKPFSQRIEIKCHLEGLDEEQTRHYIQTRLTTAGREDPIFTDDAIQLIYEHSGGIPRKINTLCNLSLLSGLGKKATSIDEQTIQEVVQEAR